MSNRCKRTDPPCRYYHPPEHLKRHLLENRYDRNERGHPSSSYRGRRNRSPSPRYRDSYYYSGNYSNNNNNNNGDYDGRYQGNNRGLENVVVNTLLPQLLFLKEQIVNSLSAGPQSSNLENALQSYRSLVGPGADNDFGFRGMNRSRDSSPYGFNKRDDIFEVCRDFLNGSCDRRECRYAHPPSRIKLNNDMTVTICLKSLRNNCKFDDCRYYHLPEHLRRFHKNGASSSRSFGAEGCDLKRRRRDWD